MSLLYGRILRRHFIRYANGLPVFALVIGCFVAGSALAQTTAPARPAAKAKIAVKKVAIDESQPTTLDPKDPKSGQDWVRLKRGEGGDVLGMQTAIVRYTGAATNGKASRTPVEVDLIGAVHIGDIAYYNRLNDLFKQYDVLLYELVAPEGTKVEKGRGTSNAHPVGALQNLAKDVLELDHQLSEIDYTKSNFVHADMSPDDFTKAMAERNDSFLKMYFRLIGAAMAHQTEAGANGGASDMELIAAFFAPDRARRLKIVLAKQLSDMENLMVSFGGEEGSVIITDRNKKALEVLKQQLAKGKKKVGIFYGAGHLNDMDMRLRKDFGLQPASITWLTAWDLAAKK
jgi:hypothetical protein